MPKKSKELGYSGKGISIVIKNDIKPYDEPIKPKTKQRRKRRTVKATTNNNFLDKNNNQIVDSKIPIYRDLYNRNINNVPQPQMVDWQAVRLGLLPPPPTAPAPPTQTPNMITPSYTNNFPAISFPDPIKGMAKLMDSMRPYFLTNNPYNTEDENISYGRGLDAVELSPEDAIIQKEAEKLAEDKVLEDTIDEVVELDEDELKNRREREKYIELQQRVAGFGAGKARQGAAKSANSLKAPAYIFNEEYMTRYNEILDAKERDIEDELNDRRQQIRAKTEAINLETDPPKKEKLRKEKKEIQQEITSITKNISKIQKIKTSIAKELVRYKELFP